MTSAHTAMSSVMPVNVYAGFKRVLTLGIVLNILVGLALICYPAKVVDLLDLPSPGTLVWVRYIGVFLIILSGTHLPLRLHPPAYRFLGVYAILLRFLFVIFFLWAGGGFLWFALYDGVFGLLLATTYRRASRKELMAYP